MTVILRLRSQAAASALFFMPNFEDLSRAQRSYHYFSLTPQVVVLFFLSTPSLPPALLPPPSSSSPPRPPSSSPPRTRFNTRTLYVCFLTVSSRTAASLGVGQPLGPFHVQVDSEQKNSVKKHVLLSAAVGRAVKQTKYCPNLSFCY